MVTWRFHGLIEPHQPYAEEVTAEPEAVPKEENKKWLRVDEQELYNFAKWVAESNPKLRKETVLAVEKFFKNYMIDL